MKLRPRQEIGTIPWEPERYGTSHLGAPLEVWKPSGECRVLVFAAIHGEEPETTFALSRALRQLGEPSPHCAVVLAANPDGLLRGTRCNARGVELNRNFPASNWRPDPVAHRFEVDGPQEVLLSPGSAPASEPETRALLELIAALAPRAAIAMHAPLACVEDPQQRALARWIAERSDLPLVESVGYETPGSFGSWAAENDLEIVTWELPLAAGDVQVERYSPVLVELLQRTDL